MTDILAEAIRAVHTEMLKEAKTCFVGGVCKSLPCSCAERFMAAALKSAYPRDPSAAVIEAMATAMREDDPIVIGLLSLTEAKETALAVYRAHPLHRALYATSPSEPT